MISENTTWAEFKFFVNHCNAKLHFWEKTDRYTVWAINGPVQAVCYINKDGGTPQTEFEANYKALSNKNLTSNTISGVKEPVGMRARLVNSHDVVITANTSKIDDWKIPQLSFSGMNKTSYFDGIEYYAKNAILGDKVTFQVVDKDGVTYPAGTVVEEFAKDWRIIPNKDKTIRLYKARLIPDMYIRVIYDSTGSTDNVHFICNLLRHLDQNSVL